MRGILLPKHNKHILLSNSVPVPRNPKISTFSLSILNFSFLVIAKRRGIVVFHVANRAAARCMAVYHIDLPTASTSGQMP
jgi:hypothetical protein